MIVVLPAFAQEGDTLSSLVIQEKFKFAGCADDVLNSANQPDSRVNCLRARVDFRTRWSLHMPEFVASRV